MQYHFVPLAQVADLLHLLADVRLTTREACYNTVRNVTACPLAGVHPEEPFDVQPYARRLAFAFLHKELTDNLPRKFKVAFAGCPEDCIATAINDVGLRAVIRDGVRGFRMTVAGGLGPLPMESKVLHEFFPAEDVVRRVEAVIRIFNRHGNRGNKNKARLKVRYARARVRLAARRDRGTVSGHRAQRRHRDAGRSAGKFRWFSASSTTERLWRFAADLRSVVTGFQQWRETNAKPQKQPGYSIVTVTVPQGNLTGDQMRGLAELSEQAGDGSLRFTMNQNVVLAYVPAGALKRVYGRIVGARAGRRRRRRNQRRDHMPGRL